MQRTLLRCLLPLPAIAVLASHVTGQTLPSTQHVLIEESPEESVTVVREGREHHWRAFREWRLVCATPAFPMTREEFERMIVQAKADRAALAHDVAPPQPAAGRAAPTFDIVFNVEGAPPTGAPEALAAVEAYLENHFAGTPLPTPIVMVVEFTDLGPNILGQTSQSVFIGDYPEIRDALLASRDSDDVILDFLPTTATLPVRLNSAADISDQATASITRANLIAMSTDDAFAGQASLIRFTNNIAFNWDFDPSDGVSDNDTCFQSVIAHEVVHTLGFTSGVRSTLVPPAALDLFRFRRTIENPETLQEFTTLPRILGFNDPDDDQDTDIVFWQERMSDGSPHGASHFRNANPGFFLMDPALARGETFWPDFMTEQDTRALDVIGYDFADPLTPEAPFADSISLLDGDPTEGPEVRFEVTFSLDVGGVDVDDFALTGTLSGDSTIDSVTVFRGGGAAVYEVTATAAPGPGTLGLSLIDNDTILTAIGMPLGGVGAGNGDLAGPEYTILESTPCPWDITGDGQVNSSDLGQLLASWGPCPPGDCPWDITGDDQVNSSDLGQLLASWGPCP